MADIPWLIVLETVFVLVVSVFMFHAALQTTVLRKVSLFLATGFFLAVGMHNVVHITGSVGLLPATIVAPLEFGLIFVGTLFFLFATIENTQNVSTGIREIREVMDKISRGDFHVDLDPRIKSRDDELGSLAASFDRLLTSLKIAASKSNAEIAEELETVGEELQAEHENFRKLFLELPIPYYVIDLDGTFLNVNDAGAAVSGRTREDYIGAHISDFDTIQGAEAGMTMIKQAAETDEPVTNEVSFSTAEGETRTSRVLVAPLHDKDGKVIAVHSVVLGTE